MTRLLVAALVAGVSIAVLTAWSFREEVAPTESFQVTALRSQVANLEAELYRAEMERCPNLGTEPKVYVAPAKKAGRK